jgi:uncharacterized protein (TIGR02145 family)
MNSAVRHGRRVGFALLAAALLSACDGSTSSSSDGSVPWNSSIAYGSLTDSRDSQVYRTVMIGSQTWMAENLNYKVDSSWCYGNSSDNCSKYGRLYQWAAAMAVSYVYNTTKLNATLPCQGICPSGWHIPSDSEWRVLVQYVDSATSGTRLKSSGGWDNSGSGTDAYGFRALPAGWRYSSDGLFYNAGSYAGFWSSSEEDQSFAWTRNLLSGYAYVYRDYDKSSGYSLRCMKNQ